MIWLAVALLALFSVFVFIVLFPEIIDLIEDKDYKKTVKKVSQSLKEMDNSLVIAVKKENINRVDLLSIFENETNFLDKIGDSKKMRSIIRNINSYYGRPIEEMLEKKSLILTIDRNDFKDYVVDSYELWNGQTVIKNSLNGKVYSINKKKLKELKNEKEIYFKGLSDSNNADKEIVKMFDEKIAEKESKVKNLYKDMADEVMEAIREDIDSARIKNSETDNEYNLKTFNKLVKEDD